MGRRLAAVRAGGKQLLLHARGEEGVFHIAVLLPLTVLLGAVGVLVSVHPRTPAGRSIPERRKWKERKYIYSRTMVLTFVVYQIV